MGDLVIATVLEVFDKGAYVALDEYGGKKGYVPLNEVSSSWFHNLRDFLRERQKTVLKVIKVDPDKGHVDLSLKRVSNVEKEKKMLKWKRAQRAETLLSFAAKRLNRSLDEAYKEVGWKLEDTFSEIYAGLEEVVRKGEEVLLNANISGEWAPAILELAKEHMEIPMVKVSGSLELRSAHPKGALHIKRSLLEALRLAGEKGYDVRIYTAGSPIYRIEVVAENYREAEAAMKEVAQTALNVLKSLGGQGLFKSER